MKHLKPISKGQTELQDFMNAINSLVDALMAVIKWITAKAA